MPKSQNDSEVNQCEDLCHGARHVGLNRMCSHPMDRPADGKSVMVLPYVGESWVLYIKLAI